MGIGICSRCEIALTENNCSPCVLRKGHGYCGSCRVIRHQDEIQKLRDNNSVREWRRKNADRTRIAARLKYLANPIEFKKRKRVYGESLKGKHTSLRRVLKHENISPDDMLWRSSYFSEIIKDKQCHYCNGVLSSCGHSLDRMSNSEKHTCFNVVPCCKRCNIMKSAHLSYNEMMLLSPVLKEIRKQREIE